LVIGGTAVGVAIWQNQHQPSQVTVEEQISSVLNAPDVKLKSGEVKGGGTVTVLASADLGEGVVVGHLPTIPSEHDYQVWAVNDAGARSLGLLPRGTATPQLLLPGITSTDTIALTEEPAGGSAQPTPPILVTVPLKGH
jgi:hypothetical protein